LHALAEARDDAIIQQVRGPGSTWESATSEQRATLLRDALLPIPRSGGQFLYAVARSISAARIVEFGTSFGVSTIYFAAALRDGGGGLVIGSELDATKVAKANQHGPVPEQLDSFVLICYDFEGVIMELFVLCKDARQWSGLLQRSSIDSGL
jgi:hypothetical protein